MAGIPIIRNEPPPPPTARARNCARTNTAHPAFKYSPPIATELTHARGRSNRRQKPQTDPSRRRRRRTTTTTKKSEGPQRNKQERTRSDWQQTCSNQTPPQNPGLCWRPASTTTSWSCRLKNSPTRENTHNIDDKEKQASGKKGRTNGHQSHRSFTLHSPRRQRQHAAPSPKSGLSTASTITTREASSSVRNHGRQVAPIHPQPVAHGPPSRTPRMP